MPTYSADQFPPEFVERVVQAHAPRQYGETGMSASAVEALTPEEHRFVLGHAAAVQRGAPERVMMDIQRATRGGAYSYLAEHIGDITHRLNSVPPDVAQTTAGPKVMMGLGVLANNADLRDMERTHGQVEAVARRYAEAHKQVPVYNKPSYHGREAAIALGRGEFTRASLHLQALRRTMADPEHFAYLMSHQGSIDYLRETEPSG